MKIKKGLGIFSRLQRRDGVSLMALIAVMVIMGVTGGVFSTLMGRWKLSAPLSINSLKAFYLAETALMYAFQDAKYRFYGGSFQYGTKASPRAIVSSSTEEADYWFERPGSGYENDDDDDDADSDDDDNTDDDSDDATANLYTIMATGKVKRGSATVATRKIKVKATITNNTSTPVNPGVYTEGSINGTGGGGFDIRNTTTGDAVTYGTGTNNITSGSESGIVYRTVPTLDENVFKALATDQGHYNSGSLAAPNNYPNGSFYYSGTVPNITYIGGNLTISGSDKIYGLFWVNGSFTLDGNAEVHGVVIAKGTVSNMTINGGGGSDIEIDGGVIQYGSSSELTGNGSPVDIRINNSFFDALNATLPKVTVNSWQEAMAAN